MVETFEDSTILDHDQNQVQTLRNVPGFPDGGERLLYRGSRDGWHASDFHKCCDNKGPTVTLIKVVTTDAKYIFGGYTDQSWDYLTATDHAKLKETYQGATPGNHLTATDHAKLKETYQGATPGNHLTATDHAKLKETYQGATPGNRRGSYKTSKASFLFSLVNAMDLPPQKLPLIHGKEDHAIYCAGDHGPTFGYDLKIVDGPNENSCICSTYLGQCYHCSQPPNPIGFLAGGQDSRVSEIEVYEMMK